jgi:hypothetical protein
VLLEEQQEIVGEALEDRVALLGLQRAGPGFPLAHLCFSKIKGPKIKK